MIFLIITGIAVLLSVIVWLVIRVSRRRADERYQVPVAPYQLLVAWRAAQCKAELRAASSMVRRELWAELDEIERRDRGQQ
jgi:hypothetical protein